MMRRMGTDTKTRFAGVYRRHRKGCAVERKRKCDCRPSYYGVAYDRTTGRNRKTATATTPTLARDLRSDLIRALDSGVLTQRTDLRLGEAVERFIAAARDGRALNKHGRRYKRRAVDDLADALTTHALPMLDHRRRLSDIRRGDVQQMVDDLNHLSGSRIRSVVNAVRSLYRWAQDRELADRDPAQHVRLPALDSKPRERVASPAEFRRLLDALPLEDALPYALAGYASGRQQEVLTLEWADVDLAAGTVRLGADAEDARKSGAALRTVPVLAPLRTLLLQAHIAQGRPTTGLVCRARKMQKRGRLSPSALRKRALVAWGWEHMPRERDRPAHWRKASDAALEPIGLHEARHSFASWCSAAGVPPAVQSKLMGHSLRLPGAAAVTAVYTHALDDDLKAARELLDGFIAEREKREAVER
jgi:integrase